MFEKTYDPAAIERRVADLWMENDAFRSGRPERAGAEPFTIVIPPPNVTGSLHMGHALNNTLQDVLARYFRMRGRDVLWQPGTDHAGIATQMVVERELAKSQQPGRREMGREAFVARVWEWKEQSGNAIYGQLKRLGASLDWSRDRFTMGAKGEATDQMVRAVTAFFVGLHDAGLLYKDKRLVNWDPKFQTAISDLEVEQIEVKGHMWYFNYPLEGETYDPADDRTFITIATTRPETMLGDGAVAVHPGNETIGWKIGRTAILPLVNRRLPIIADTYADPEKGTGAVKITAAHDFNDYEVYRRHQDKVPLINLMTSEAKMVDEPHMPEAYRGLDRYACRKRVVADLEAMGLVLKIEPHTHMVPHGDRSGVVIEPWLTDQWYVNVKPLAEQAMAAVKDGRTRILPENREADFFRWMENIEPWCVSRQLWWGHRIPAWYGPDGGYVVARDETEARDKARAKWGDDVALRRDEDVLDTWFSSALWPFSTLGWPDQDPLLARRYPTSALVTGADILFFWVARMMMAGLFTQHEVPFRDVYLHGLVRDAKGRKMSKSVGNVIDPLDVMDVYGADALRITIVSMAAQNRDPKIGKDTAESYRNFCTKLWNAARFARMNGATGVPDFDPGTLSLPLNRWIVASAARAAAEVAAAIESYRFNEAALSAYRFVWNSFCDWHLELAKPLLQGEDGPAKVETRATVAHVLDEVLKLLHPFMPFITEELWQITGETTGRTMLLCHAQWSSAGFSDAAAEAEIDWVIGLVSAVRSVRAEMNVPASAVIPLVAVQPSSLTSDRLAAWSDMIRRLARIEAITVADAAPPQSAQIIQAGEVAALPLAGVIDIAAEKARLTKELGRIDADIVGTRKKLENADFVARAPEEVIEENRERLAAAETRRSRLMEAVSRL
jgi:valyl-tRNA synthetase